jgi:hypothetical protein
MSSKLIFLYIIYLRVFYRRELLRKVRPVVTQVLDLLPISEIMYQQYL